MKILFSSELGGEWMSGWQRCHTLKRLGHQVIEFRTDRYHEHATVRNPVSRLLGRVYEDRIIESFNRDVLAAVVREDPEAAWFEWPFLLKGETLREISSRRPRCRLLSFQDDNPFGSRPGEPDRWKHFLEAIPAYDLHFVKRESDVSEFRRNGARNVRTFMHGFYAPLFCPPAEKRGAEGMMHAASFVGTALDHRVSYIAELLAKRSIPLRIYGNKWNRTWCYFRDRNAFHPAVLGEDYVRVIVASKANLGFVSSSNHDDYTMRTFEIPACGGFFLAERTPTHQELFEEGREAEFFNSVEECADKILFYLAHETARSRIAEAGYRRCLHSDYSLDRRMSEALAEARNLR